MDSQPRVFDRVIQFDPRSRNFAAVDLLPHSLVRSFTWSCGVWNDQGSEGACVGFGWSHELAARPAVIPTTSEDARAIYLLAQKLDAWEGEGYSGTSVLAGIKAVQLLYKGKITEYRWAFGLEDLVRVLGFHGPAVLGVNWYTGMFNVDSEGFIRVTGLHVGGHAILARAGRLVWLDAKQRKIFANVDLDRSYATLRNSWGQGWGRNGDCFITLRDLGRLLDERGEACVPVKRGRI